MPIDIWALRCVTYSLQNRCLPCIRSSDNEDSEREIVKNSGEILLCIHCTPRRDRIAPRRLGHILSHPLITMLSYEGRLAKGVHTGKCAGDCSVGVRPKVYTLVCG